MTYVNLLPTARLPADAAAIHRIACETEAASDVRLEGLKKERLTLLDEIAVMLEEAPAG